MKSKRKIAVLLSAFILGSISVQSFSFADSNNYEAYMKGYPDGSFKPSKTVSRAEVAVLISSLIRNDEEIDDNIEFKDIKKGHWAYESVNYLRTKEIISSDKDNYDIKSDMTRGELSSVIVKAYNLTKDEDNSKKFDDIEKNIYKDYIDTVVSNGYMSGYPSGNFEPDKAVSRAEIASIINLVSGRPSKKEDIEKIKGNLIIPSDIKQSHWAYYNILSATNNIKNMDELNETISKEKEEKSSSDKKQDIKDEKIDYKNLKDGRYSVNVELLKAEGDKTPTNSSMASAAVIKKAVLEVKDEQAKIYIGIKPMKIGESEGNLTDAWYYKDKFEYISSLSASNNIMPKSVEITDDYLYLQQSEKNEKSKTMSFPIKSGEEFVYIKVEVDIMKSLGGANPDAVIKIDWNTITKINQ